eukprot:28359-Amphidinium_carterae.1
MALYYSTRMCRRNVEYDWTADRKAVVGVYQLRRGIRRTSVRISRYLGVHAWRVVIPYVRVITHLGLPLRHTGLLGGGSRIGHGLPGNP